MKRHEQQQQLLLLVLVVPAPSKNGGWSQESLTWASSRWPWVPTDARPRGRRARTQSRLARSAPANGTPRASTLESAGNARTVPCTGTRPGSSRIRSTRVGRCRGACCVWFVLVLDGRLDRRTARHSTYRRLLRISEWMKHAKQWPSGARPTASMSQAAQNMPQWFTRAQLGWSALDASSLPYL